MKYNYVFTDNSGETPKTFKLNNSTLSFGYVRSLTYSAHGNALMSSLMMESLTIDDDAELNNLFTFLTSIEGGSFSCVQYETENNTKTFEINKKLLGASLSVNNGVMAADKNTRGFALSLKLDFGEE